MPSTLVITTTEAATKPPAIYAPVQSMGWTASAYCGLASLCDSGFFCHDEDYDDANHFYHSGDEFDARFSSPPARLMVKMSATCTLASLSTVHYSTMSKSV